MSTVGRRVGSQTLDAETPDGARPNASRNLSAAIAPALFDFDQMAAYLCVGSRKARELEEQGLLPAPIVLGPRHRRWSRVDLDASIATMPRQALKAAEPAQLARQRIERLKSKGTPE